MDVMPKAQSAMRPRPCALSSTGYTYAHSPSYSWSVLEFEQERRTKPVVEAPRMSRRSLRLHTPASGGAGVHALNYSLQERHSSVSREDRPVKSRRVSQSLLLTPQKSQSAAPLNSSMHSCTTPSDASLLSSLLDESCIQERTLMDSFWGLDEDGDQKDRTILASGDVLTAQTQTTVVSGYRCTDCSFQQSGSTQPSASSAAAAPHQHQHKAHNTTVYSRDKARKHRPADWRHGGNMNAEGHPKQDGHRDASTSLCDDCKGMQQLDTCTTGTRTRFPTMHRSQGVLLAFLACAGHGLLWAGQKLVRLIWLVAQKTSALLWLAVMSQAQGCSSVWQRMLSLMSLLRDFLFIRCLPIPHRLLLLLLPLLLLMVLCLWRPSVLWAVLPASNWKVGSLLGSALRETPSEQGSAIAYAPPPFPAESQSSSLSLLSLVSECERRVGRLEGVVEQLWALARQAERRRQERSAQHAALQRSLRSLEQLQQRVMGAMEEKLQPLEEEVERGAKAMKRQQQSYMSQQQSNEARVAELEAQLERLTKKAEDIERAQETKPAPVSEVVDHASHEALLQKVQTLQAALDTISADLVGLRGCQGHCEQLDNIQNMVSAQVRQELQELFYGSEGGAVPDSLLPWLSARFVNGSDLQASLAAMEQSILGNVSQLMERNEHKEQSARAQILSQSVRHSTSPTGLSEEHVELMVKNALRLYSQDRTGMVDYALESGGGSILSTRCSQTFETKTALMSLFGIPLWYFTQSPRTVIQPDVHPGNCWAFKGSHGYLVIRLSTRVVPTAFSLEHIPKSLSPTGQITSAPRHYTVYGLEDESQEEGKLLGRYTYEEDGEALQTRPVMEPNDQAFQIIELRVLSNWGHSEYTCIYRFRVHGQPSPL